MTLEILTTPLPFTPAWPVERKGGFDQTLLDAILPAAGTEAVRAKLAQPDVLVVTTGQQPALFTGPLYTIHKALSAKALAELLEARWGRPVVPLFWLAGDDHDFAEARSTSWLRGDGTVGNYSLHPRAADASQLPMYRTHVGGEVTELLSALESDLRTLQHTKSVAEWLHRHWTVGTSVAGAYGGSLAELFAPLGILCFDPTHRVSKRAMARHLIKAAGLARDLDRDLATRAEELHKAGLDGGVVVGDGATLLMLEATQGRDRLVVTDQGFETRRSGEQFTMDQLQRIAAEDPERLSPNVLLRPVIESAILPTVAYIGGPGELAYWKLTPPIYERMRIEPQLATPRWSGAIVEPQVERLLVDLKTSIEELLAPGTALESRLARSDVPTEAADALAHLVASIARDFEVMQRSGGTIAPQLERALDSLRQRMEWLAGKADAKLLAHVKRRDEERMTRIRRARESLRPLGRPQERVFTVAPFLARHGPGLLPELAVVIRAWYAAALEGRRSNP